MCDLPICPFLPDIVGMLKAAGVLVVTAEPGAGKTSLVPLAIAEGLGAAGKVIVVEPRRVAAIAAATRLAELGDFSLGREVGYRVKGESRAGGATRIEVVTAGVLVRMLGSDPLLEEVAVLVFDEFHERSLDLDLALALAREARSARGMGLRILVMSATLDSEGLGRELEAPTLHVPGRVFPIETRHAELGPADVLRWTADAILEMAGRDGGRRVSEDRGGRGPAEAGDKGPAEAGDMLVFLPGMAEILRVEALVAGRLAEAGIETLKLHSSLPLEEQRRVVSGAFSGQTAGSSQEAGQHPARRVILSTSIAETSLTVPRVRIVIDCGLARGIRFDRRSGLNRLVTERESADRAEQRRGRAGRLGPGLCLRAWPRTEILPERSPPEILRADLSDLVLACLVWGAATPAELRWIDAPPLVAWNDAIETLRGLGAVGRAREGGSQQAQKPPAEQPQAQKPPAPMPPAQEPKVTARGREMAAIGIEARLAALVIAGRDAEGGARGSGSGACLAAALLDLGGSYGEADFACRVAELARSRLRDLDFAARRCLDEARRIAARAGISFDLALVDEAGLPPLLAAAWPDRVARRVDFGGNTAVFMLPAGRRIRAGQALAASPWIVAVEADAGESLGRLYAGLAIGEDEALAALQALVESVTEIEWKGRGYRARRLRRAGVLELSSTAMGALDRGSLVEAARIRLVKEGLATLFPDAEAEAFLARYAYWRSVPGNEGLPDIAGGDGEGREAYDWLLSWIETEPTNILPGTRLRQALEERLPQDLRRRFRIEVPESIELPSGVVRPLLYDQGPQPLVEGRVHDFYGLAEHPRVAGVPVVLRLLSPAGRPIQVTADLPGFWRGAWAEARKELRGRYPKHDWPEDPAGARASRKGLKPRRE